MGAFRQQLMVAMDGIEDQVRARHVAVAREILDEAVSARPVRPHVTQVIDGRIGAPLDAVKVPGVILFRLGILQEITTYALGAAKKLSPRRSGRYAQSWFAMVDGKPYDGRPLPPDATVFVVNPVPYARKLHVRSRSVKLTHWGMKLGVTPGIVDRITNDIRARYGDSVRAFVKFIDLPNAYILKGDPPRKFAAKTRRSSAFRAGRSLIKTDRHRGQPITYPAIELRQARSFD